MEKPGQQANVIQLSLRAHLKKHPPRLNGAGAFYGYTDEESSCNVFLKNSVSIGRGCSDPVNGELVNTLYSKKAKLSRPDKRE